MWLCKPTGFRTRSPNPCKDRVNSVTMHLRWESEGRDRRIDGSSSARYPVIKSSVSNKVEGRE